MIVLLNDDLASRNTESDLVKNKLLCEGAIMFVTESFPDPKPAEADIEDLIDPSVYADLVNYTYAKELYGKILSLDVSTPRIVKRYEQAFTAIGLDFNKARPAREFISRMGTDPASVLPTTSAVRFEAVFKVVRERYDRMKMVGRARFD